MWRPGMSHQQVKTQVDIFTQKEFTQRCDPSVDLKAIEANTARHEVNEFSVSKQLNGVRLFRSFTVPPILFK